MNECTRHLHKAFDEKKKKKNPDKLKSYAPRHKISMNKVCAIYQLIPYSSYPPKHFTQIYRAQYGNPMLVSH